MNDSKITSVYYLAYPDCNPPDENCAYSEVYIEVGGPDATSDNFDKTYSVIIATPEGLSKKLSESPNKCLFEKSLILIPVFNDVVICRLLDELLPEMGRFACRVD
jgi:hypothetical protein